VKEWLTIHSTSKRSLVFTALLAFSCILGIDIHTPSLPNMVNYFESSNDVLQLAVTLFVLGAGMGIFVWGPLADQYGRKPILITGVNIVTLSTILAIFSHNIYLFLGLRFLQGVGSGAAMCLCRVIAADLLDKKQLAVIGSTIGLITGMAPMLAPIIGGYVEESVGWQGSFIIYALMTSLSLLLFIQYYTESLVEQSEERNIIRQYLPVFKHRKFMLFGILQGTVLSVLNCYAVVAPFLVQEEMGFSPVFFGWLSGYCAICQLLSKVLSPIVIRRYGTMKIHTLGWILLLASGSSLLYRYAFIPENTNVFIFSIGLAFFSIHLIIPYLFSEVMSLSTKGKGILGAGFASIGMIFSFILSSIIALIPYEGSGLLGGYYIILAITGVLLSRLT